ncbi:MAG: hypothetical protein IJX77_10365 [Ruminococcus sp.]|nr:hypothetical protein [Ruminococcus sp.]
MIKKFISICSAFVLVSGLYAANAVNAAFEAPEITMSNIPYIYADESDSMKNSSNPDLYALASSLGADTDYLNVVNYVHETVEELNNECYVEYLHNASNVEAFRYPASTYSAAISGGRCLGISILEILSHNGFINPSDIQSGAEKLCEINRTAESDKFITDYQALQAHTELDIYQHYLASTLSSDEQIDRLIDLAEMNMAEKEYFLITYQTDTIAHAVVGIGITDGEWNYNEINYDKCVLTLDSNLSDKDGNAKGFSETMCIYINSASKQFYIPAYESGSEEEMLIVSIDDESLLNYKGTLRPSESVETDLSLLNKIELNQSYKTDYSMVVTNLDGTQYNGIEANLNQFGSLTSSHYFLSGSKFCIESTPFETESSKAYGISITDTNRWIYASLENAAKLIVEKNKLSLINRADTEMYYDLYIRMNEDAYNFTPHYSWNFEGVAADDFNAEVIENGILLSGKNGIKAWITINDILFDENGYIVNVEADTKTAAVTAAGNVLITFNENKQLNFMLDNNGDGIYDCEVMKGDVDCNNSINAIDASYVLTGYAAIQTGKNHYINENLGDYNSDGKMDALDASEVLTYYAKTQVENMQ